MSLAPNTDLRILTRVKGIKSFRIVPKDSFRTRMEKVKPKGAVESNRDLCCCSQLLGHV